MSKLFNLKEWLTVADAAKHLSVVFGEEVTEVDVLRLAVEGRLQLSVYLPHYATAKPAHLMPIPEELKLLPGVTLFGDQIVCVRSDEVTQIIGLLDLPMVGSELSEIEDRCCSLLNGKVVEPSLGHHVIVQDANGLYELQGMLAGPIDFGFEESDGPGDEQRKFADKAFYPIGGLPADSILAVRTNALRAFEQSINGSLSEKAMASSERNSLLTIIAALCDYSAIKHQERGTASRIARMTEEIGAPVSDDTVRRALARIPDALESRMK